MDISIQRTGATTVLSVMLSVFMALPPTGALEQSQNPDPAAGAGEQQQATLYPIPDYSGDLFSRPALIGD